MKKSLLIIAVYLIIFAGFSLQNISAQEKSKDEKEKEYRMQIAIEEEKKAMSEKKKAQEETLKDLQEAQQDIDESLKDIDVDVNVEVPDVPDMDFRHAKRIERYFRSDDPIVISPGVGQFWSHSFGGDNESSSWEFSKSVKEKSIRNEYVFDVEKTSSTVVMSVMGDCKVGEIRIKILMPSGKTYSEIVIDEFGNLNWRKSFTISETENQDKTGAWKFQISSSKATGYFKISLQTY